MKEYKVGDIVYIKSLSWYQNSPKDIWGCVNIPKFFVSDMSFYCGRQAKIMEVLKSDIKFYKIDIDTKNHIWTDQMFDNNKYRKEKLLNIEKI